MTFFRLSEVEKITIFGLSFFAVGDLEFHIRKNKQWHNKKIMSCIDIKLPRISFYWLYYKDKILYSNVRLKINN